jgi:hypothetical protein
MALKADVQNVYDENSSTREKLKSSNKQFFRGKSSFLRKPSKQRLRWGEDHVLPHVNWGGLFFDLFYVVSYQIKKPNH